MFMATPEHCHQNFFLGLPPSLVKQGSFGLTFGVSRNGGAARMCEVNVIRNSADARTKTHKEVHLQRYSGFDVAEVTLQRYTFVLLNILLW